MKKILLESAILVVVVATVFFVYREYGDRIIATLFGEQPTVIYIESLAVSVMVADEEEEWRRGLSGITELGELEGKLFVFDEEDYYGIWMKDMLLPLDIIWVNDEYKVVHIEQNVQPDSYPKSFTSDEPARFVLEVNAYFVQSFNVQEGDTLKIPPKILPDDLREKLQ